ncbi:hypothetical protein BDV93DRAFT_563547 [Ceratobasidium sp. AG-I]|nr:hypothetical protein BDV93DRAFT_563547 [Ceratobasidium sp. AG-I]
MSRDTESVMSSAVSISGTEPFSDDGSTLGVGGDMSGVAAGNPGSSLFDLGDGDLHIAINGATLETHRFLVKRFASLKDRIKNETITLEPGEPGLEIFKNAFKILYASVVEGPFEFDHATLTSALLLATKYHYPALRTFAITKLENAALSAVERIRLAREFDIPLWEEPAYLELCERDEAITMSEAGILGLEAVVHVAKIREKEQRKRGKEVDAAEEIKGQEPDDQVGVSGTINALETLAKSNLTNSTISTPKPDKDKESEIKSPGNNALETTVKQIQVAMSQPKPTAENTSETAPTPSLRPGTLKDDVRNWLGSKRRANVES